MSYTQEQLQAFRAMSKKFKNHNDFINFIEDTPFSDVVPTKMNKAIEEALAMIKASKDDIVYPIMNVRPYSLPSRCHFNTYAFLQKENQDGKWKHIFGWDITTNKEGTFAELEYHSILYNEKDNVYGTPRNVGCAAFAHG
jgi:hypothetical protein